MRKTSVFVLVLLLTTAAFSQTYYDAPKRALKDTLGTVSRITRDFFFNPANDSTGRVENFGAVDLNIVSLMSSTIQTTDTAVVDAYGLKRVWHSHAIYGLDMSKVYASDSTRIGTIPVGAAETLSSFALDLLFSSFYLYDGVRVVYKLGGSDADSVDLYSNVRVYVPFRE